MSFARRDFTVVRSIVLDGFTDDPDWVGNYDAASARAAGSVTAEPAITGQVDVLLAYADTNGNLLPPGNATSLDFQVIGLGTGAIIPAGIDAIFAFASQNNHVVDQIATLERKLAGPTVVTVRVSGLTFTPAGAITLGCAIRVG